MTNSYKSRESEQRAKAQEHSTPEKGPVELVPFFDTADHKASGESDGSRSPDRDLDLDREEPDASAGWRAEYAYQHVPREATDR